MNAGFAIHVVTRWRWILTLAALSAMAVYWFLNEPVREISVAQSRASTPDSSTHQSESATVANEDSTMPKRDRGDPFALRTWEPPPPSMVSTPTPPPPPQAPPLPFKFFGRILDSTQTPSFILTRGTEMITVHVGDRIEPAYLVDKFDGTHLHLVYRPLNIRQTIFVGNANE